MSSTTLIQTFGLSKKYPGVLALNSVEFNLLAGEVHVLFGENGAGKSTLISLLSGAISPSDGRILLGEDEVHFESVADARERGIYTVFQEFSLIPTLTVAQNIFLGCEPMKGPFIDRSVMYDRTKKIFEKLDFDIDPNQTTQYLSRAQQQMVEIVKALQGDLLILILDEPTASLTDHETKQLFGFIKDLKARGVGIIYISHRMEEFNQIADRITVLRDGTKIGTVSMKDTDQTLLVKMMTGRTIKEIYPKIKQKKGEAILTVDNIKSAGVNNCSFIVKSGEVLGVSGLVGSGKSRLFRSIMGLAKRDGSIILSGKDISRSTTRNVINSGMYYLSSDRKNEGLDLSKTSNNNLALNLIMGRYSKKKFINWVEIASQSGKVADYVKLSNKYRRKLISQLSGGNQQKVLFGKCFGHDPQVYIFDEPTVGVDMATRLVLYLLIKELAESGKAIVVISSDLLEVMNLCHRILVMANGHIKATLKGDEIREEKILKFFFN